MKMIVARTCKNISTVLLASMILGCDQMGDAVSGVGGATKSLADKVTGNDAPQDDDDGAGEAATVTVVETEEEPDPEPEADPEPDPDPRSEDDDEDADDHDSGGRDVEQYPRLPRNVTWKPVSHSSGGNLTIILWGAGGGEKNYEKGSLKVEHNDGVTYPRKYIRRDDPDNHERAPKFLFDVKGGWFQGKDPVLFWNLGAYRVVSPEKRQGKNEES